MIYDEDDLGSFKLVLWREARGDGDEGMRAVGHVIVNRVGAVGFPRTVHDVIYQKNAFTSMSVSSDPEYNLEPKPGDPQFAYISSVAPAILGGTDPDPTDGARYYANLKHVTSGWFVEAIVDNPKEHPLRAEIGNQSFFA